MRPLLALLACATPAWADCTGYDRTFLACDFPNGKSVELCLTDTHARYSFGRDGQTPELALELAFGQGAEAIPWGGVGRSIWEAVRLTNGNVTYEVYGGFDRFAAIEDSPDYKEHPQFGGINVLDRNEDIIAQLECIPETVDYAF